jgi:hypothetical protein
MACNCKKKPKINPKTGEYNFDKISDLPIDRDIWLPSPSDDHGVDIETLMDQSRVFVSNVNHPVKRTYIIPVGNPEPKKSFKEKIKSFFKL